MNSGIYMIINKIDNKKYIGLSKNLEKRHDTHLSDLRRNCHANSKLQYAWNKYGGDNFDFQTIEKCEENEMSEKEKYYIRKYNTTDKKYGYNLTTGGECGYEYTEDVIENMRLVQESKPILQIDLNGQIINRWHGFREAAAKLNITLSNIQFCCTGKKKNRLYKDYIWIYEKDYNDGLINIKDVVEIAIDSIDKTKVVQLDLDFNYIKTWDSATEIFTILGCDESSIRKCCNGKLAQVKGYRWVTLYNYKRNIYPCSNVKMKLSRKVVQYDLEYNIVNTYKNATEASKITGFPNQNIHMACSIDGKSHGYYWKFIV